MQFITLNELAKFNFNIGTMNIRTPLYKEGSTYHINETHRTSTGLVYLKNCDMTTTSLHTNSCYKFHKNSLVLLPELSRYYSIFSNIDDSNPSFYIINMSLTSNTSDKIIVEKEPFLIFENTPESISRIFSHFPTDSDSTAFVKSQIYMMWHLIFENLNMNNKIKSSAEYINITNKTNKELAAELNISVSTLTRMFKKHYNTTPASYALQAKMLSARTHLVHSDMSVSQIASNLGFNSVEHFSRIFKKHNGLSPMKYRNTYNNK